MRKPTKARSGLRHVQSMVFNQPLLIQPARAEVICAYLNQRMFGIEPANLDFTALAASQIEFMDDESGHDGHDKPYQTWGPIAVIQVIGETVHRKGDMDALSGLTSYQEFTESHRAAMTDPMIKGIMTVIDSPGGSVPGLQVCADEIVAGSARKGGKPHMAYMNESAFSAGYWLAAAHDMIMAPNHGMGGSIGACMMMVDRSKMLEDEGIRPVMIRSADRKNRGNGLEPIDDETVAKMQTIVDRLGADFNAFVATQRRMPVEMVAATQAEIFMADDLKMMNLIDDIGTIDEAFEALLIAARK